MMKRENSGFTMVELLVASAISVVVITMAMIAFVKQLEDWKEDTVENKLAIDLEMSLEMIRKDLRLSSVGTSVMAFYPSGAVEYEAISFPQAADTDGDNVLDIVRDASENIIWAKTVVYHIRPTTPNQMIRTVYSPRNTNATPADLYAQLVAVVASSDTADLAAAAMSGESLSTRILFENLVGLQIRPSDVIFDGYAATPQKAETVNFGSLILSNGLHDLTFTCVGTNGSSSGYKIGIDKISLSVSGGGREAEIFDPINAHPVSPHFRYVLSGGSITCADMSAYGPNWSGNAQMTYDAGAISNSITFKILNDIWTDTNFDDPVAKSKTDVMTTYDSSFILVAPGIPDKVVAMDAGTAWRADVTTDTSADFESTNALIIVNVIHGSIHPTAGAIMRNGCFARFRFDAGQASPCRISSAYVGERAGNSMNVSGGTGANITFGGGATVDIAAGTNQWSDWVSNYVIDDDISYLVGYKLEDTGGGTAGIASWTRTNDTAEMSSLDTVSNSTIYALAEIETRYPNEGVYLSGIFDTQIDNPDYQRLFWTDVEVYEGATLAGDVDLRIRCGDEPDLSDTAGWLPVGSYFQAGDGGGGGNIISGLDPGRYVQYEALFTAKGSHTNTAKLRDVTITWNTEAGIADLRVDFAKGPDYGMVAATVDGLSCSKGLEIEMEIYEDTRYRRKTVTGAMEIRPLNTGK